MSNKYCLIDGYYHDKYLKRIYKEHFEYTKNIENALTFSSKHEGLRYMKENGLFGMFDIVKEI